VPVVLPCVPQRGVSAQRARRPRLHAAAGACQRSPVERLARGARQGDVQLETPAAARGSCDRSTVRLDDRASDRKAEPGSSGGTASGTIGAVERLEEE
jgi:hypothetical protein